MGDADLISSEVAAAFTHPTHLAALEMEATMPSIPGLGPASFVGLALALTLTSTAPAGATTIHVPGDFPTIQEAINAAIPGDVILVAPGTYTGPLNTSLDFGGKDIELRSTNGPDVTIITDSALRLKAAARPLDPAVDAWAAVPMPIFTFQSGESPSALVDGFTITRGFSLIGGIRCINNSSPTIRNCVLSWHNFGAMECNNASPSIENCTFSDNALPQSVAGAGLKCINNSSPRITDCTFLRNNARAGVYGGGIYCQSSNATITGCVFQENGGEGGGGIACDFSTLVINDCDFENNDTDNDGGAGVLCYFSSATIATSRFYNNRGRDRAGVALRCLDSTVMVTNCTFVGNDGPHPTSSQVHAYVPGQITLENTIVAFSSGKAVTCDGGNATLVCCDLFGNQGGDWTDCIAGQLGVDGNFAGDPRFCDLLAGDLTLNDDSPCMPGNHPQGEKCGLIGAFGRGCGATSVDATTWGGIKAAFSR